MHANDDERTADMANPAAKYAEEFRRETADCIISTGGPVTKCCWGSAFVQSRCAL